MNITCKWTKVKLNLVLNDILRKISFETQIYIKEP